MVLHRQTLLTEEKIKIKKKSRNICTTELL